MLAKRQNVLDNDKSENVAASRQSNNLLKKKMKTKESTKWLQKYRASMITDIFKNPNFTNTFF